MKVQSLTLLTLLLLATLTVAGCGPLFHHCGPHRCGTPCEMAAGQKPCPPQENCVKPAENKPCCDKMKAAETPAQ
jgi:hypothetical protein